MYLSQVEIDINNRRKIRDLSHLGAYHNWVENSFPEEIDKNVRSRKLWRIDHLNNKTYLLLASKTIPDLEKLEQYGVENTARTKDYTPFLESLENGMKVRFRVTLNTVKSVVTEVGKRGRVQPVKSSEQMKFLIDRSEKNGFSLKEDEFTIVERGYKKLKRKNERTIDLISATYEGVLTIENVGEFRKTLTEGIGKKKAYGFGMMTVIK